VPLNVSLQNTGGGGFPLNCVGDWMFVGPLVKRRKNACKVRSTVRALLPASFVPGREMAKLVQRKIPGSLDDVRIAAAEPMRPGKFKEREDEGRYRHGRSLTEAAGGPVIVQFAKGTCVSLRCNPFQQAR
jgi:hypothetical protein